MCYKYKDIKIIASNLIKFSKITFRKIYLPVEC